MGLRNKLARLATITTLLGGTAALVAAAAPAASAATSGSVAPAATQDAWVLPTDPAPWLLTIAAGALLTSAGFAGLLRSRRGRPVTG